MLFLYAPEGLAHWMPASGAGTVRHTRKASGGRGPGGPTVPWRRRRRHAHPEGQTGRRKICPVANPGVRLAGSPGNEPAGCRPPSAAPGGEVDIPPLAPVIPLDVEGGGRWWRSGAAGVTAALPGFSGRGGRVGGAGFRPVRPAAAGE